MIGKLAPYAGSAKVLAQKWQVPVSGGAVAALVRSRVKGWNATGFSKEPLLPSVSEAIGSNTIGV